MTEAHVPNKPAPNAYCAALESHRVSDQRNADGHWLCACGKKMSRRHLSAIGSAAQRKADAAAAAAKAGV